MNKTPKAKSAKTKSAKTKSAKAKTAKAKTAKVAKVRTAKVAKTTVAKRPTAKTKVAEPAKAKTATAQTAKHARDEALRTSTSTHPLKTPVSKREERAIERLRRICLALPEVTEKISWGEPTWRAGKIFAQMDTRHHGAEHVAVWLPAEPGAQQALVASDPAQFFVPPYVGVKGWVGVRIDRSPDWDLVASLVEDSYRLVAPPRLRAQLAPR